MEENNSETKLQTVQRVLDKWEEKAEKATVLTAQYTRCSNIYKNTDKAFRGSISICSLIAAYMISFQGSSNKALTEDTGGISTAFYLEIFFSFSAAAISIIAQVINFPGLIDDNGRKALEFKDAKKYCHNQAMHCKWVRENILGECPKIANITIIRLKDTKRAYEESWQSLAHVSRCCSNCCNIGIDDNSTKERDRPPPYFVGGDTEAIQLSPALRWIQARWPSPKNNNPEIELCDCTIVGAPETKENEDSSVETIKSETDNEQVVIDVE